MNRQFTTDRLGNTLWGRYISETPPPTPTSHHRLYPRASARGGGGGGCQSWWGRQRTILARGIILQQKWRRNGCIAVSPPTEQLMKAGGVIRSFSSFSNLDESDSSPHPQRDAAKLWFQSEDDSDQGTTKMSLLSQRVFEVWETQRFQRVNRHRESVGMHGLAQMSWFIA